MCYSRTSIVISVFIWLGTVIFNPGNCSDPLEEHTKKISSSLMDDFEADASIKKNIVVNFDKKPRHVLNMLMVELESRSGGDGDKAATREEEDELHQTYVKLLQLMREESQEEIIKFLEGEEIESHMSCWVSNQLFVKGASRELVKALGNFKNVEEIHEEKIFNIHKPLDEGPVIEESRSIEELDINSGGWEWNIKKIKAPRARMGGKRKMCKMGFIDTGVRSSHKAFKNVKFVAWKDPVNGRSKPYDDNGHGTHVCGTMVGGGGIGVASGFAKMYACKACKADGTCSQSHITECLEFMTRHKPHVVSNSWGGPGGDSTYDSIIEGWKASGILGIFSAGNSGPRCNTVGSPADNTQVVSVGSTTRFDTLSKFSSRGVANNGRICPTVSAPGSDIKSAWMTSDNAYKTISGTSMATPHVTGLFALIFAKHPDITARKAKKAIINSCRTSGLSDAHQSCGGTLSNEFPNNMFGNGLIDCTKAVTLVAAQSEQ